MAFWEKRSTFADETQMGDGVTVRLYQLKLSSYGLFIPYTCHSFRNCGDSVHEAFRRFHKTIARSRNLCYLYRLFLFPLVILEDDSIRRCLCFMGGVGNCIGKHHCRRVFQATLRFRGRHWHRTHSSGSSGAQPLFKCIRALRGADVWHFPGRKRFRQRWPEA